MTDRNLELNMALIRYTIALEELYNRSDTRTGNTLAMVQVSY